MRAYYFGIPSDPRDAIAFTIDDARIEALYPIEEAQALVGIINGGIEVAVDVAIEMGWFVARSIDELMKIWRGEQPQDWWVGYEEDLQWE